jgi:hypothetical protein
MKKLLALILAAILVMSFCGCSSEPDTTAAKKSFEAFLAYNGRVMENFSMYTESVEETPDGKQYLKYILPDFGNYIFLIDLEEPNNIYGGYPNSDLYIYWENGQPVVADEK